MVLMMDALRIKREDILRLAEKYGARNVRVFGSEEGGFDVERVAVSEPRAVVWVLDLVLSVGIGEVEVRRG